MISQQRMYDYKGVVNIISFRGCFYSPSDSLTVGISEAHLSATFSGSQRAIKEGRTRGAFCPGVALNLAGCELRKEPRAAESGILDKPPARCTTGAGRKGQSAIVGLL